MINIKIIQSIFLFLTFFFSTLIGSAATAQTAKTIFVFGPGGPAPAMKEAAQAFQKKTGIKVELKSGPTSEWKKDALLRADLIYSGSENMMDSFAQEKLIKPESIETLFIRPSVLLVRPGNPKKVTGLKDLIQKAVPTIVVNGAGQVGMWEDVVGRLQNVEALNQFRKLIVLSAENSGVAEKYWNSHPEAEAWLIFNIWGTRSSNQSQVVPIEKELTIYRSAGIAKGINSQNSESPKFIEFLKSPEAVPIFEKHGWSK